MSAPTKEYLLAKANMCRNLALTQIDAGEGEKAAKNLMRMVKALGEVGIIIERESKDIDKFICKECKYEISNFAWWNIAKTYEGEYLCDDCDMNLQINEREAE